MRTPPPPGWTKTLTELLAENRGVSGQEIEWARAYEQEQLRSWARFPRSGEVYELNEDAEVSYVTHWESPFTGGGKGILRRGTRVRIADDIADPEPISVHADAMDKARIEQELVPEVDRNAEAYAGFSLSIKTAELNRLFRIVVDTDAG